MHKKRMVAVGTLLASVVTVQSALIQHLSATNVESVVKDGSGVVSQWNDQTGYGNNAVSKGGAGKVYYPSTSLSASGKPGLNFGTTLNTLVAMDATKASNVLNSANGFAVLIAFKADALNPLDFNDLIGCGSTLGGFGIRYHHKNGALSVYLSSNSVNNASKPVAAGDTIVVGFNYDDTTGKYSFWNSKSSRAVSSTLTAAQKDQNDFSRGQALTLGALGRVGNRYINGMICEIRVYDATLSVRDFTAAQTEMVNTWAIPEPVTVGMK